MFIMKKILLLVLCVFSFGCSTISADSEYVKYHSRITFYHKYQDGGDRVAMSGKMRAQEGVTIAAHPTFKFGTKVKIPSLAGIVGDGTFIVQDRGSAVTKKKASKGKAYVFDVYIHAPNRAAANKKMHRIIRKVGDYADVKVYNKYQ